jgi:tetratricopeptide (TPR) repeat protein
MDANATIDHGLKFHRSGDLAGAELVYREILEKSPDHADALHLLGMVCHQSARADEAERLIRRAISVVPNQAVFHSNLGLVLAAMGKREEASDAYRRAAQLDPESAEALNNLGVASCQAGDAVEGMDAFKRALLIRPDYADAQKNLLTIMSLLWGEAKANHTLGDFFQEAGRYESAIDFYRKAIAIDSASAESWNNLGNALFAHGDRQQAIASYQSALSLKPDFPQACNNLANALKEAGRYEEAMAAYERAIALQPDSPEPLSNLGNLVREAGQWETAVQLYERALAIDASHPSTLNNLGNAYCEKGRFTDAVSCYEKAIDSKPNYSDAINNLGTALEELGQRDRAMAFYQKAMQLDPSAVSPPWNIALQQLLRGDYENGWRGYEHRWQQKKQSRSKRNFTQPMPATVGDLKGKRVLLHAEQGFGDALQFCRYVPSVAQLAAEVIFECPAELRRLFEISFVEPHPRDTGLRPVPVAPEEQDLSASEPTSTGRRPVSRKMVSPIRVIEKGTLLPAFDLHCPLMSLPMVFGTTLQTIPAEVPYLKPDPADVERWRSRFADQPPGLRVGLVWAGQSTHQKDRHRSLALADFADLAKVPDVQFYSLQVGESAVQAKSPPAGVRLIDWTSDLHDFADTAALIAQLDLVITVDTAVCHLAGAMRKGVWVLLAYQPDWRWLLDRTDSPWYASAALFRQTQPEDWSTPLLQISAKLEYLSKKHKL